MTDKHDPNKWADEFKAFLATKETPPPPELSHAVRSQIMNSLNPSSWSVLGKLTVIHIVSASVTLLVCPQFGFSPLGGGYGLLHFFMRWGVFACATFCGTLFLGTTALVSQLVMSPEERRVVLKSQLWQLPILGMVSMMMLMLLARLSAKELSETSVYFASVWLIMGSILAVAVSHLTCRMRLILRWG